jgi:hypothetical protein
MVINPHFANLPRVTSPVSQTVNQNQMNQGINALGDFGGLGQPGRPGSAPALGQTQFSNPADSAPRSQPGAPIGYNPSPVPMTRQPGLFGGQAPVNLNQPGRMSMPTGLLPPTGLENQPIAMPQPEPKFTFGAPPSMMVEPNPVPGMNFGFPEGELRMMVEPDPGTYPMPNTQPNPDRNQYNSNTAPADTGQMYTGPSVSAQPGSGAMQIRSGAHRIDPAEAVARSQYAHAMPAGLTEQQQFDYLNPRAQQPAQQPDNPFAQYGQYADRLQQEFNNQRNNYYKTEANDQYYSSPAAFINQQANELLDQYKSSDAINAYYANNNPDQNPLGATGGGGYWSRGFDWDTGLDFGQGGEIMSGGQLYIPQGNGTYLNVNTGKVMRQEMPQQDPNNFDLGMYIGGRPRPIFRPQDPNAGYGIDPGFDMGFAGDLGLGPVLGNNPSADNWFDNLTPEQRSQFFTFNV